MVSRKKTKRPSGTVMINERVISEKFNSIWKISFPFLNSNFMRVFNERQVHKFEQLEVSMPNDIRYDLVAECAFNIVAKAYNTCSVDDIICDSNILNAIVEYTAKSIWLSGNYNKTELILNKGEIDQVTQLSNNFLEFITSHNANTVNFRPSLKGFGFIPDLEADISIDNTLYEVKTVKRKFKTSDLKQLSIYLALRQVDDNHKSWEYAGLYNPRTGAYSKFKVSSFVSSVTGGKTPNEAFRDFLDSLIRDMQVDSKF